VRFKLLAVLALAATPLFANPTLFSKYENVRQGLLKNSLKDVQSSAKQLASAATTAKNDAIAKAADAVAKSADLDQAREAFGTLSDEMIKLRGETTGDKPGVAYCPMAKKSWLQSTKEAIANPYEPAMKECGMWKKDQ
jgi:hypothetical protein